MTAIVTIDGQPATRCALHVPGTGPWHADVDLEGDPDITGQVTLRIGELELVGSVREERAGTFGLRRQLRLVAGAGAWSSSLGAKGYHNDAGVRARTVVEDLVRETGEQLGDFAPAAERIGRDYVRSAGLAARSLEDVIGGAEWWVDYAGVTQVGARASSSPDAQSYEVLDFDPRARLVTLAVDDPRAVEIGAVLSERLDTPQTVRELELEVGDTLRVRAWCGTAANAGLAAVLRSIVGRITDRAIFGPRKYRLVRMSVDRCELQAVRRGGLLPDILPISMWPGLAGAHADLTPGAEVLVQFIDGDPTQPVITHFAGKDGNGWSPVDLTLDASSTIKLGAAATAAAARADLVSARLDTLQQAHDTHKHPTAATGPASLPDVLVGALGAVAATKVKVE